MMRGIVHRGYRRHGSLCIFTAFLFGCLMGLSNNAFAEIAGEGWYEPTAELIGVRQAEAILKDQTKTEQTKDYASNLTAALNIPEIKELARGLKHDPMRIFEYVVNHIDYVPYFGFLKGPEVTLLDRAGNDFDQAALLITLLRASGFGADFVYGTMTIPAAFTSNGQDLAHWFGVEENSVLVEHILANGGIPATFHGDNVEVRRVWVRASITGTEYHLDPAFKQVEKLAGIDIGTASGFDLAVLNGSAGGTEDSSSIKNLNESALRSKLREYTTNLINYIQANRPNDSIEQILGNYATVQRSFDVLPETPDFAYTIDAVWSEVPSQYIHKVRIEHGALDETLNIPDIAGKKLAISYDVPANLKKQTVSNMLFNADTPETLKVVSPAAPQPVALSGNKAVAAKSGSIGVFCSTSWDFGRINQSGSASMRSCQISNPPGNPGLTVRLTIPSASNTPYRIDGDTDGDGVYSYTINGGSSKTFVVRLTGQGVSRGQKNQGMTVSSYFSGQSASSHTVNLSGFVAQSPDLSGSYGFNYGQSFQGVPLEGSARLKNSGDYTLKITNITRNGSDSARFSPVSGFGTGNVGAGATRNLTLKYKADQIGTHTENAKVTFTYDGIAGYVVDLGYKGETIPYVNARLSLDDRIIATEGLPQPGMDISRMVLTVDHPYSANNGDYTDQRVTYQLKRGGRYIILSGFGQSQSGGLLAKRQQKLADLSAGESAGSVQLLTETLNVMGQTWMKQTALSEQLIAQLNNTRSFYHHRFGLMAQEEGFYIDIKAQVSNGTVRLTSASTNPSFKTSGFLSSAMEHGVIEQLQDAVAASTVKLIQLNNQNGQKLYKVTSNNWSTIKNQVQGYSTDQKSNIQTILNETGSYVILPHRGDISLQQWQGAGYIGYSENSNGQSQQMAIDGDYTSSMAMGFSPESEMLLAADYPELSNRVFHGGYGGTPSMISPPPVLTNSNTIQTPPTEIPQIRAIDPVDIATGHYLYELPPISLGSVEPWGATLQPRYTSQQYRQDSGLGYGWDHNYSISVENYTDYDAGLGKRSARDASAAIIATYATLQLMQSNSLSAKTWGMAALIAKWEMDQLLENGYSVSLNQRKMSFIKLPSGSYSSPPGSTATLSKVSGKFRLEERFSPRLDFDSENRIQYWRDADNNTATFAYSDGKLIRVTDKGGRYLVFTYSGDHLSEVTDSAGRKVQFAYNNKDQLTQYTDVNNGLWTFTYDSNNRIRKVTNPLNIQTVDNRYDSLGRVKEQYFPTQDGTAVNRVYYAAFKNIEQDNEGNEITHYFDENGLETGIENALGAKTATMYDGQHHPVEQIDPRGNRSTAVYDGYHNVISSTNALNQTSTNEYDSQHRRIASQNPLGQTTSYQYDAEHHLLETTIEGDNAQTISERATYTDNGQVHSTITPNGVSTLYTYDAMGYVNTEKTGAHPVIDYDYDHLGRRVQIIPQEGGATTFIYNNLGKVTQIIDPLGRTTTFTYNVLGQNTSITDRNNETTSFSYTPHGNIETISYHDGSQTQYTYDSRDNVTKMTDTLGDTVYVYDGANRLRQHTDPNGFTVGYQYDANGNITALSYPGNKMVSYQYDALNRLSGFTNWLNQSTHYQYDEAGRLLETRNANGTTTRYSYDLANRLLTLTTQKSDGDIINQQQFTLDLNGNRISETKVQPQAPTEQAKTINYSYNAQKNRLTEISDGSTQSVSHDVEGQTQSKGSTVYQFNSRHQVTNLNGDIFEYDGAGNRLKATRGGVVTYYIYDAANNLLAEANASKQITRYYVHGADLSQMIEGNQAYTYHFDAIGSTIAITDQGQNIVNQYAYSPYGRDLGKAETRPQPFTYVGQHGVMAEQNDHYYMRARYYDADIGRFISEDPIGFEGGINLYAYASNNPVNWVDPEGLCTEYNSGTLLRALVPGQMAWDNAITDFAQGDYGGAALNAAQMLGEQVLTAFGARVIQQGSRGIAQGINESVNAVRSVRVIYHGTHPAHHSFPIIGKQPHLQWTIYRQGVKKSHLNIRIPVPWGR